MDRAHLDERIMRITFIKQMCNHTLQFLDYRWLRTEHQVNASSAGILSMPDLVEDVLYLLVGATKIVC